MDPRTFCAQTGVAIVAGKGGVGKTTVTATLARLASRAGLSVLIVEIEGKGGLAACFDSPALDYESQRLVEGDPGSGRGEISARTLTADQALLEYLDDHGLRRVSRRLARTGAVDVIATAAPGIKDILLLGKVKQLERQRVADLILLDAPAAGHALTFLRAPRALLDTVSGGPIRDQAEGVLEMLADRSRCQTILVTLPEETPVNEVVECAFALEDEVGTDLGPVVVNALYPALDDLPADAAAAAAEGGEAVSAGDAAVLDAATAFRLARQRLQEEQVERLARTLPLPQLHLPILTTATMGLAGIDELADVLTVQIAALDSPR